MARGDVAHAAGAERGALRVALAAVVVLALAAGGVATWRYDLLDRWLDYDDLPAATAPLGEPASIAPPSGLDLPPVTAPEPVAEESSDDDRVDRAAVRRALAGYLSDADLGRHVLAEAAPLMGAVTSFTQGEGVAIPASTTKLVTTTAALLALGPDHVFTTTVVAEGARRNRRLVLVGGGDPFLERAPETPDGDAWPYPVRADLDTLATQAAKALREDGVRRVTLGYDDSLFSGPAVNPTWEPGYIPDGDVSPTSALWVDEGRPLSRLGRVADPASEAAEAFVDALGRAGIKVSEPPVPVTASVEARTVADIESAPLGQIVERILDVSDNEASEVLLRHIGLAGDDEGSIEAGRHGVRRLLDAAGVRLGESTFYDGSGLSRDNRADPSLLIDVLQLAASDEHPDLRPVIAGLPVAGFTGSLTDRMEKGPAAGRGRVRAKTGTLTAVSTLAGLATDLDGTVMVFVLMADRVGLPDTLDARDALDSAAAALGACRCSG